MFAVAVVFEEYLAPLEGGVCVVDEGIDFEVVLETAEIDVGRAYGGQRVVCDY